MTTTPMEGITWKPHEKSMTLGQLALHVATIPGDLSRLAQVDEFDAANANFIPPVPESAGQIMVALEQSVAAAASYLNALDAGKAGAPWRLTLRGNEAFAMPRPDRRRKSAQLRTAGSIGNPVWSYHLDGRL